MQSGGLYCPLANQRMVRCLLTKGVLSRFFIPDLTSSVMKVNITAVVLHKKRNSARANLMEF